MPAPRVTQFIDPTGAGDAFAAGYLAEWIKTGDAEAAVRAGTLLAVRRPENPVGWILLALALLITASVVAEGIYGPSDGDPEPGPPVAAGPLAQCRPCIPGPATLHA